MNTIKNNPTKKSKLLFVINSLRGGGAEKVLVNLVNRLNPQKYNITLLVLFGDGVNKQFLHSNIKVVRLFKKAPFGFVHIAKLVPSSWLHKLFIKGKYDIEISYLQGVCTRIVGGAPKDSSTVAWIHNFDRPDRLFRSPKEMHSILEKSSMVACVSKHTKEQVDRACNGKAISKVLYNTQDVDTILRFSKEPVEILMREKGLKFVAIGTLYDVKGYLRLLKCLYKLKLERFDFKMYFVGDGPQRKELEEFVATHGMGDYVAFFGFNKNPYKYLAKADLFICSSYTEGFSGTVSEATILGIPTLTTECAGMKEILGEHNEYGIVVENSDKGLEEGIRNILDNPDILKHYKEAVRKRSDFFKPEKTVSEVETMFDNLVKK